MYTRTHSLTATRRNIELGDFGGLAVTPSQPFGPRERANDSKQSKRNQLGEPTNFSNLFPCLPACRSTEQNPLRYPFLDPPNQTQTQTQSQSHGRQSKEQAATNSHKMNVYTAAVKIIACEMTFHLKSYGLHFIFFFTEY